MKRFIEWILAGIGAIMCIGGAASIWRYQATASPPNVTLWLMPALLVIDVALLGVAGFLGIALEAHKFYVEWGFLVWIACGGLLALSVLGAMSVSVIVLLAIPASIFGMAAILADRRRDRRILPDLGILAVSGIANFGLFLTLTTIGRL